MATFPRAIGDRFGDLIASLSKRVGLLERRTAVLDSGMWVVHYTGTIPGSYVSGDPQVTITGQSTPSGPYPCLTWYTPHAGDTVLLIPVGQSYIVAGTYS